MTPANLEIDTLGAEMRAETAQVTPYCDSKDVEGALKLPI
jgi:hypothetical protein